MMRNKALKDRSKSKLVEFSKHFIIVLKSVSGLLLLRSN